MSVRKNHWFDRAFIAGTVLLSLTAAAAAAFTPRNAEDGVAVVFAPWVSQDVALSRALSPGARLVGQGGLPFVFIVRPDDRGYNARVRAAGAMVLDAETVGGCLKALGLRSRA